VSGAIFVCSLKIELSFAELKYWKRSFDYYTKHEKTPCFLVANKVDLNEDFHEEIFRKFCKRFGFIGW
jgi:GTPase SAR1 family protein